MIVSDHSRSEVLFLALTRPALVWGVPFEALALNSGLTFFAGMVLQGHTIWRSPIMFWLAAIPVHLAMRRLTSWDFHWSRTLLLWAQTTAAGRPSLESLPTEQPRLAKDCASSG